MLQFVYQCCKKIHISYGIHAWTFRPDPNPTFFQNTDPNPYLTKKQTDPRHNLQGIVNTLFPSQIKIRYAKSKDFGVVIQD